MQLTKALIFNLFLAVPHAFAAGPVIWGPGGQAKNLQSGGMVTPGTLALKNTSGSQPILQCYEDPDNGTNSVSIQATASLSADYTLTLPVDDGTTDQALTTNGSGVLSWSTVGVETRTTGSLDSEFNGGTYVVIKVGNVITVTINDWAWSSTRTSTSSSALVPSGSRPVAEASMLCRSSGATNAVYFMFVSTAGNIIVLPRADNDLGSSANVANLGGVTCSVSYAL